MVEVVITDKKTKKVVLRCDASSFHEEIKFGEGGGVPTPAGAPRLVVVLAPSKKVEE